MTDRKPLRVISTPPDAAAMERKRKRAARAEDHALQHASTAVANAAAHLETAPRMLLACYIAGVVTGAIIMAAIGAVLEMAR